MVSMYEYSNSSFMEDARMDGIAYASFSVSNSDFVIMPRVCLDHGVPLDEIMSTDALVLRLHWWISRFKFRTGQSGRLSAMGSLYPI